MVREEEEEHMVNGIALNMMLRLQWFVWEWDKSVFSVILAENKVKCFEVTEVNPTLDEQKCNGWNRFQDFEICDEKYWSLSVKTGESKSLVYSIIAHKPYRF